MISPKVTAAELPAHPSTCGRQHSGAPRLRHRPGPDSGLGTSGEALHAWAFSDDPDERRARLGRSRPGLPGLRGDVLLPLLQPCQHRAQGQLPPVMRHARRGWRCRSACATSGRLWPSTPATRPRRADAPSRAPDCGARARPTSPHTWPRRPAAAPGAGTARGGADHRRVCQSSGPPATQRTWPETKPAASAVKNATALAMSSGLPMRCTGM